MWETAVRRVVAVELASVDVARVRDALALPGAAEGCKPVASRLRAWRVGQLEEGVVFQHDAGGRIADE